MHSNDVYIKVQLRYQVIGNEVVDFDSLYNVQHVPLWIEGAWFHWRNCFIINRQKKGGDL